MIARALPPPRAPRAAGVRDKKETTEGALLLIVRRASGSTFRIRADTARR